VQRAVQESLHMYGRAKSVEDSIVRETGGDMAVIDVIRELEQEMADAASKLEYERAALLRDQIRELKRQAGMATDDTGAPVQKKPVRYGKGKPARKK
jgi:excinuclease ABC subunit B